MRATSPYTREVSTQKNDPRALVVVNWSVYVYAVGAMLVIAWNFMKSFN